MPDGIITSIRDPNIYYYVITFQITNIFIKFLFILDKLFNFYLHKHKLLFHKVVWSLSYLSQDYILPLIYNPNGGILHRHPEPFLGIWAILRNNVHSMVYSVAYGLVNFRNVQNNLLIIGTC